jgi:hypothetical protein
VPQYLFEEAVASGRGGATNIIICQPRRIAAVGLATRVADEVRGQGLLLLLLLLPGRFATVVMWWRVQQ